MATTRPKAARQGPFRPRARRPYVYSVTAKAVRAAGYPSVEAMREVIAARFTPAELAVIANAFEKDTAMLTRGVRHGRRREVDAAPELPDRLTVEGAI